MIFDNTAFNFLNRYGGLMFTLAILACKNQ